MSPGRLATTRRCAHLDEGRLLEVAGQFKPCQRNPWSRPLGSDAVKAGLRLDRFDDDPAAPSFDDVAAARNSQRALLDQRPQRVGNPLRILVSRDGCGLGLQPLGESALADVVADGPAKRVEQRASILPMSAWIASFTTAGTRTLDDGCASSGLSIVQASPSPMSKCGPARSSGCPHGCSIGRPVPA